MLLKSYITVGILTCLGFAAAAIGGWKGPSFSLGPSYGGVYGGGRGSTSSYSHWHGGK